MNCVDYRSKVGGFIVVSLANLLMSNIYVTFNECILKPRYRIAFDDIISTMLLRLSCWAKSIRQQL